MIYISTRYYGYTYANEVEKECFYDPSMCYEKDATPSNEAFSNHPEAGWIYNSNKSKDDSNIQMMWLLSSCADSRDHVFFVSESGRVENNLYHIPGGVRPVVYLTSDVKIISGTGKENDPYILSK